MSVFLIACIELVFNTGCDAFEFGVDCGLRCDDCTIANVVSCDNVNGTCQCSQVNLTEGELSWSKYGRKGNCHTFKIDGKRFVRFVIMKGGVMSLQLTGIDMNWS